MQDRLRSKIVANPRSANGALEKQWPKLYGTIASICGETETAFTAKPGDGTALTRTALRDGCEMVVAMGGDGTISEVVAGFFENGRAINPDAVLGVLPFGTGGDFRKTVGISRDVTQSAPLLCGHSARSIDVGHMSFIDHEGKQAERYFVNIASFGMSGLVSRLVNETTKVLGGRISFAWATVRAMRRYRSQRAFLKLDDARPVETELQTVAVANGKYFGGGMMVAPGASLDDGCFDVVTLGPMGLRDLLLNGHRIYSGTHLALPSVTFSRARRIEATPGEEGAAILLDVDGETPGQLPAVFSVIPSGIKLKTM
jgi:YegS/Rv2252/BmrU family lipid kinase